MAGYMRTSLWRQGPDLRFQVVYHYPGQGGMREHVLVDVRVPHPGESQAVTAVESVLAAALSELAEL